jgi:hypothetical protein
MGEFLRSAGATGMAGVLYILGFARHWLRPPS